MAKDQPKRLFGQISTLPFTDNKTDSGSRDASRFVLPFAENVKTDNAAINNAVRLPYTENIPQDKQIVQRNSDLPYKENMPVVENKNIKDTVRLPFIENVQVDNKDLQNPVILPFVENIAAQNKADELKKDIDFTTVPLPENRAGADFGEPVWRKIEWGGLNLRDTIDSGELSYAKNLSTDAYPCLVPRPSRSVFEDNISSPMGLFSIEEGLLWVGVHSFGGTEYNTLFFYKASNATTYKFKLKSEDTIRSMVDYNGKVLIFPDKVYLDYTNLPSDGSTLPDIPDMDNPGDVIDIDYATVYNNRVFGVHGDEIFSNTLGKFNDWTQSEGVTTDAFATDVASQGDFVGCAMYKNHVYFFKPNFIHEMWGINPPFRLQDLYSIGTTNHQSIKEVDGKLFFCWKNGVYVYAGGKPENISLNLDKNILEAAAGTDGRKYYVSINDGEETGLYVFDTEFNKWIKEDDLEVVEFTYWKDHLYALTYDGNIIKFNSGNEAVEWEATTEYFARDIINKYIHEIRLRLEVEELSNISIAIQYDEGDFEQVADYYTEMTCNDFDNADLTCAEIDALDNTCNLSEQGVGFNIPTMRVLKYSIIPKQAYRYRIKFVGTGHVKIHAMEILMSTGGD